MAQPARIAQGYLTRSGAAVPFRFDKREFAGLAGDTLASALLANGIRLVGRSFKYHRPRGIVTAGHEEPCALVDVVGAAGREPNRLATTLELTPGLVAESQNRWPSLRFDTLAINDRLSRFLPAGFYYKAFMRPGWAWEKVYEPAIRRAAGLGRLDAVVGAHAEPAEIVHAHADALVVGAGTAGLSAAQALGGRGLRVIVADREVVPGAAALLDPRWIPWRDATLATLRTLGGVRMLPRTTVVGAYGHGVFGALETLASADPARADGLRERLWVIRARRVLVATGATERLIAFPGNDVPGVMLAGAALAYLRRYGVAVGAHPALFANHDQAYDTAFALADAGVPVATIVDPRPASLAAERARARGLDVRPASVVVGIDGRRAVRALRIAALADGRTTTIAADCLLMSGGWTPATSLPAQLGAPLRWHDGTAAFVPELAPAEGRVAGAARGVLGLDAAARDGQAAAVTLAAELGAAAPLAAPRVERPADPESSALAPLWEVPGSGKAFVDLQNDVTTSDVRLAHREGYEHVEHMKRFTTHGMATDQGRIGGLVGSAVLAAARGVALADMGQPRPRPYEEPVPFQALAGPEVRAHYKLKRRLPLHDWHEAAGATFVPTGLWLRPLVYSKQSGWEPVLAEARAARRAVGITDVSTLGKLDVQGPDAARFLDFIYANTMSTLAVGRARYGIMLRDDGMLLDDGTAARLGPQHFVLTTTTANATPTLEHLEFHLEASCPELDVVLADVTDQWAQIAVAGPKAREVVAGVVTGLELGNDAFPFMAAAEARIAGLRGRLFRISFSGELAYELAVPAAHAATAWRALLDAGRPHGITPYGLDALNTLRIEKGHVTGAELNGNTCAADLGMQRMMKSKGDFLGRALASRPGMLAADRLQLVGVRPVARSVRLRNGTHLVEAEAPGASLGYITSSTPSVESPGWVGLALVAGGRARVGSRLLAASPVHGERYEVEIVSPHMLDPENHRVRA